MSTNPKRAPRKKRTKPRKPVLSEHAWQKGNREVSAYAFSVHGTCLVDPRVTEDGFSQQVNPLTYYGITEAETRALDAANLKLLGYIPRFSHPEDYAPRGHTPPPEWLHDHLSQIGRYSYGGYTLIYDRAKRVVRITKPGTKFRGTAETFRRAERYIDTLIIKKKKTTKKKQ